MALNRQKIPSTGHNGGSSLDQEALAILQQRITHQPLDHLAFFELGDVWERGGRLGEAAVAYERALQLREYNDLNRETDGTSRLRDLQAAVAHPERCLELAGFSFPRLSEGAASSGAILQARSTDGSATLKIAFGADGERRKNMAREAQALADLNRGECVCAPTLLAAGEVTCADLIRCLDHETAERVGSLGAASLPYLVHSFLKNHDGWGFADVALAMLELRSFGYTNLGISALDVRYDAETGVCCLADFSLCTPLQKGSDHLPARTFFESIATGGAGTWDKRSFGGTLQAIHQDGRWAESFAGEALNLARTRAFVPQLTTGVSGRILHTVHERDVWIDGVSTLTPDRKKLLDRVCLRPGETVLDAGCAGGLVAHYLARRGCCVTGLDVDQHLMSGCQMMAHVLDLAIHYRKVDLDYDDVPGQFETVFALGLLPHLKNREESCAKLAAAARDRILVEVALDEPGYKWVRNSFQRTKPWSHRDDYALAAYLEDLFPGFRHLRTYGANEDGQLLMEYRRDRKEER